MALTVRGRRGFDLLYEQAALTGFVVVSHTGKGVEQQRCRRREPHDCLAQPAEFGSPLSACVEIFVCACDLRAGKHVFCFFLSSFLLGRMVGQACERVCKRSGASLYVCSFTDNTVCYFFFLQQCSDGGRRLYEGRFLHKDRIGLAHRIHPVEELHRRLGSGRPHAHTHTRARAPTHPNPRPRSWSDRPAIHRHSVFARTAGQQGGVAATERRMRSCTHRTTPRGRRPGPTDRTKSILHGLDRPRATTRGPWAKNKKKTTVRTPSVTAVSVPTLLASWVEVVAVLASAAADAARARLRRGAEPADASSSRMRSRSCDLAQRRPRRQKPWFCSGKNQGGRGQSATNQGRAAYRALDGPQRTGSRCPGHRSAAQHRRPGRASGPTAPTRRLSLRARRPRAPPTAAGGSWPRPVPARRAPCTPRMGSRHMPLAQLVFSRARGCALGTYALR